MTRLILFVCAAMAAMLCMSVAAEAHKVNIFAYVDGNSVVTDSGYSRSKRVNNGLVEVYNQASGDLLLSGMTDENGLFTFDIPDQARKEGMNLRLLLKAGEGHQAEWVVKAEEYGAETAAAVAEAPEVETQEKNIESASLSEARITAIVRNELAPVKRMLAEVNQSGPSMTEIIGGIGWILGLFGVAAYMKSRKS